MVQVRLSVSEIVSSMQDIRLHLCSKLTDFVLTLPPKLPLVCMTGKSNLMDAISFVLGVKSAQLRSSQLRELIYRDRVDDSQDNNRPGTSKAARVENDSDPRKTWVMAVYQKEDGCEIKFVRR